MFKFDGWLCNIDRYKGVSLWGGDHLIRYIISQTGQKRGDAVYCDNGRRQTSRRPYRPGNNSRSLSRHSTAVEAFIQQPYIRILNQTEGNYDFYDKYTLDVQSTFIPDTHFFFLNNTKPQNIKTSHTSIYYQEKSIKIINSQLSVDNIRYIEFKHS